MQPVGKPRASKKTFWTMKRLENGLTLQELSELMSIDYSTMGKYLTGQYLPATSIIVKLCDLLNVSYDEGVKEFCNAHKVWGSRKTHYKPRKKAEDSPVKAEETPENAPETPSEAPENVLKAVYGKLTYDEYETVREKIRGGMPTLEFLYNSKIDFDTFVKVTKILAEEEEKKNGK